MLGLSLSFVRVEQRATLHRPGRLCMGFAALLLLTSPSVTHAQDAKCSDQAREGLERVGLWALAACEPESQSPGGAAPTDPSIVQRLSFIGGWAADAARAPALAVDAEPQGEQVPAPGTSTRVLPPAPDQTGATDSTSTSEGGSE
jgi:hypothetical protein